MGVRVAQALLEVPVAVLALGGRHRLHLKAAAGLGEAPGWEQVPAGLYPLMEYMVAGGGPVAFGVAPPPDRAAGVAGSVLGVPVLLPDGHAVGALCAFDPAPRDWTERHGARLADLARLAEREIELHIARRRHLGSTERLRKIASQVPGLIYQYLRRPDGHVSFPYASEGIRDIFRLTPEDVRDDARRVLALLPPDEADGFIAAIRESADRLTPWQHEFRVRFPDGTEEWLRGDSTPERLPDGSTLWHGFIKNITERKKHDLELQAALDEVRGRQFAIDQHAIVAITDVAGRIVYANDRFCEIAGYAQNELLGQNHRILKSGVHPPEFYAEMWRTISHGRTWQGEICNRRKDGTRYWVSSTFAPLLGKDGKPERYFAIRTDITTRKLQEEALRRSKLLQEAILASTEYMMVAIDKRGFVVSVNEAASRGLGYTAAELVGQADPTVWHEAGEIAQRARVLSAELGETVAPGVEVFIARSRVTGGADEHEWTIVRKDGTRFPALVSVTCLREASGDVFGYVGMMQDITERRRQEEALRKSEARFRQSFLHAGIGTAIVGIDGYWREANPALLAMLGYTREEFQRLTVQDITHPADLSVGRDEAPKLLSGEIPVLRATKRYRRADGRYIWGQLTAVIVRDSTGQPVEYVSQIEDITAARAAAEAKAALERKLAETAKLESLGVLAGGIAHDFNNILTGVLGHASLLKLELPPDSPHLEPLERIEEAAKRAADLCRQMLAYSGKGRFVVRAIDLNAVISETTHLLKISISKHTTLTYRLEANLPAIEADDTQIRQIVMNLVINASEAIGERGGVVAIETGTTRLDAAAIAALHAQTELTPGEYVSLEVSDDGCGMAPDVAARIFDPFFTTKFTGRGLGLAAVQGIVRGHRGTIRVCTEPGKGTTFQLLFPRSAAAPAVERPADGAAPARGAGRVLVVDDEATVRAVAARSLEFAGFQVDQAADGEEALTLFRPDPARYVLVLLDLTMPRLGGEETFHAMRRLRPEVRVLLMSGFDQQEVVARFTGQGLAGFVAKPIDSVELIARACALTA